MRGLNAGFPPTGVSGSNAGWQIGNRGRLARSNAAEKARPEPLKNAMPPALLHGTVFCPESASNAYYENYCERFENECAYSLGSNEDGIPFYQLPENSRYIKSEDILYEIKKIQQKAILEHGLTYDYMQEGLSLEKAQSVLNKKKEQRIENIIFSQEKYSNGETSLQFFQEYLLPNALYLLDEPEVSLSPANQVALAQEINELTHYLGCQFIIATHSPFMLGTLNAKIYNLDAREYEVTPWYKLENVRYFYDFFKKHEKEFND